MKFLKFAMSLCAGLMMAGAGYAQEPVMQDAVTPQTKTQTDVKQQSAARDQPLRDAEALMRAGKPADAYALLEPLEFERSGEVRFDYLLGIAALDSGKPDKATLAFERVLAVNPNHTAARLDMARAYYQLGDMVRAEDEFRITLNQNPSEAARATIRKYLDEIGAGQAAQQTTRFSGYIEGAMGRDTNVNDSTDQAQIAIPSAGNVVASLNPTNVKIADNYYRAAAGGEVIHSLDADWGVYAGADLSQRGNQSQKAFDELGLNGRTGVLYGADADRFRAGLSAGQYTLGNVRNRNIAGIDGEYRHIWSPSNQLNVFGQMTSYRFADPVMQLNDFNQQVIGTGWLHAFTDGRSSVTASVYHGAQQDVSNLITPATPAGGRTDGASTFNGARFGGQAVYGDRTTLFASTGGQLANYGKLNPFFLRQRADKQYDLTLGSIWRWDKLWSVRPQLTYMRNSSNIVIYSYNLADASLTLRRDFK